VELISHTYKFVYALDAASTKILDTHLPLTFAPPTTTHGVFGIRKRYILRDQPFKEEREHLGLATLRISGLESRSDKGYLTVVAHDVNDLSVWPSQIEAYLWRDAVNKSELRLGSLATASKRVVKSDAPIPRHKGGREKNHRARLLQKAVKATLSEGFGTKEFAFWKGAIAAAKDEVGDNEDD
jgi:hypothetical protein